MQTGTIFLNILHVIRLSSSLCSAKLEATSIGRINVLINPEGRMSERAAKRLYNLKEKKRKFSSSGVESSRLKHKDFFPLTLFHTSALHFFSLWHCSFSRYSGTCMCKHLPQWQRLYSPAQVCWGFSGPNSWITGNPQGTPPSHRGPFKVAPLKQSCIVRGSALERKVRRELTPRCWVSRGETTTDAAATFLHSGLWL